MVNLWNPAVMVHETNQKLKERLPYRMLLPTEPRVHRGTPVGPELRLSKDPPVSLQMFTVEDGSLMGQLWIYDTDVVFRVTDRDGQSVRGAQAEEFLKALGDRNSVLRKALNEWIQVTKKEQSPRPGAPRPQGPRIVPDSCTIRNQRRCIERLFSEGPGPVLAALQEQFREPTPEITLERG